MIRRSVTVPFEFDGQQHVVTPDFRTVNALEQREGFSFGRLSEGIETSTAKVSDLAWLMHVALTTAGHRHPNRTAITMEDCGQAIIDKPKGMQVASAFAREFIWETFTPGPSDPLESDGEEAEPGKA